MNPVQVAVKVPVMRVYNDQLLIFEQFDCSFPRSEAQKENEKNLTRGLFNGFMSPKTKSKVKKYLSTWIDSGMMISKSGLKNQLDKIPYFTFVTLTLPASQAHSDNEIKRKCLVPFISTLQRKFDVWHYFWRAESQKNGNIHFHLIIDSFIDHGRLRVEWNECINKLGYVDRFAESFHHTNPNSTDIHSFKNVHSPASYVIKYCCKSDGYRKINGRIHGCSDGLKMLKPYEQLIDGKTDTFLHKCANDVKNTVIKKDDFTVIKCSTKSMIEKYYPELRKRLIDHQLSTAFFLYKIELPPDIQAMVDKSERRKLIQLEIFQGECYDYAGRQARAHIFMN